MSEAVVNEFVLVRFPLYEEGNLESDCAETKQGGCSTFVKSFMRKCKFPEQGVFAAWIIYICTCVYISTYMRVCVCTFCHALHWIQRCHEYLTAISIAARASVFTGVVSAHVPLYLRVGKQMNYQAGSPSGGVTT